MPTPTPAALEAGFVQNANKGAVTALAAKLGKFDYVSNDTKAQVETSGYFNPVREYLKVGDDILVTGDLDGTPFVSMYVVDDVPADGSDVTITEIAAVTQNVQQVLTVTIPALGTDTDHYVVSPIAGEITAVEGVSNGANGSAASTIDIAVDGSDVANLSFSDSYVAGTRVTDATVQSNTLSAGEVITINNNGEGNGTGEVVLSIMITPS